MSERLITKGQMRKLMREFADAIQDDLRFELAQKWADRMAAVMPYILQCMPDEALIALNGYSRNPDASSDSLLLPPMISPYPEDGKTFLLSMTRIVTGRELFAGKNQSDKRQFVGKEITVRETKRFKLVSIDYAENLPDVRQQTTRGGCLTPQGQWLLVFKDFYPLPSGTGGVWIADDSWMNPEGKPQVPMLRDDGYLTFCETLGFMGKPKDFHHATRWLVEVPKGK